MPLRQNTILQVGARSRAGVAVQASLAGRFGRVIRSYFFFYGGSAGKCDLTSARTDLDSFAVLSSVPCSHQYTTTRSVVAVLLCSMHPCRHCSDAGRCPLLSVMVCVQYVQSFAHIPVVSMPILDSRMVRMQWLSWKTPGGCWTRL